MQKYIPLFLFAVAGGLLTTGCGSMKGLVQVHVIKPEPMMGPMIVPGPPPGAYYQGGGSVEDIKAQQQAELRRLRELEQIKRNDEQIRRQRAKLHQRPLGCVPPADNGPVFRDRPLTPEHEAFVARAVPRPIPLNERDEFERELRRLNPDMGKSPSGKLPRQGVLPRFEGRSTPLPPPQPKGLKKGLGAPDTLVLVKSQTTR